MRKINIKLIIIFLMLLCHSSAATIIYVDDDARSVNVGTSWENAINSLQDALLLAYFYDEPVEIRVAQGTYTPDEGIGIMPGDREASFQLLNNVTIKGGYAGPGTRDPNARNSDRFTSILSGDLNHNDVEVNELSNLLEEPTRSENSYHIITCSDIDETAVLDGFTITGGVANSYQPVTQSYGGGMIILSGSLTLKNCTFIRNSSSEGGGIYNKSSNLTLTNCRFVENYAGDIGGGMQNKDSNPIFLNCSFIRNVAPGGGGMCNNHSSPILTNCTFSSNTGNGDGGGMYNLESKPALADCIFSENLTEGSGGGIYNENCYLELLNCEFRANSSQGNGGGIFNNTHSELYSTNCIFSRNSAAVGGGMENLDGSNSILLNCTFSDNSAENRYGGLSNASDGRLTLINCILWGDTPDEIAGSANVLYSNIEKSGRIYIDVGVGNIDIDPLFADPDNGDYHLKSQAGRWDPTIESWVIDEVSSPCIDAGDPDSPVGLERFPNGDRINIGAYGGTPQASLSPQYLQRPPSQASNPNPADEAENISVYVTLSWTPGLNATSHNVYFGIDIPLLFVGNQIAAEFYPGILNSGQTYYWRIDEVTGEGEIITGEVWSFTTTQTPPKGRTCFTADTPVWVNGAIVPISRAGLEQTICRTSIMGKTQEVQEHEGTFTCYDVLLASGNCISVAECHYFLEESGRWISLQELKAGTKLQTSTDSIEIISVTKRPAPYVGKVYNLKIEGSDRYLVGKDAIIVRDY